MAGTSQRPRLQPGRATPPARGRRPAVVDDLHERTAYLEDLEILNMELRRLGVPPLISDAAASLYPAGDLPALIRATRAYLSKIVTDLGGVM